MVYYWGMQRKPALKYLGAIGFKEYYKQTLGMVAKCIEMSYDTHKQLPNALLLIKPDVVAAKSVPDPFLWQKKILDVGMYHGEASETIPPERILASAELAEDEQRRMMLKVGGDKGIGSYSEEERKRLFGAFSRALSKKILKSFLGKQ